MGGMTPVDWIIVAIVVISSLISLKRGFVKEALSLASLVIAVLVARVFGSQVSTLLADYISVPSVRLAVAYFALFIVTMAVGSMINHLISHVVEMTGLSGTDRLLGMIFGLARGGLIVLVVVGVLARLPVTDDPWWKASRLIPYLVSAADAAQGWVVGMTGNKLDMT
ncbi:MAG: CvpA family protein [Pseudomonadales bacterium]|nr:CvpA family protein [Pseudomonadales bacterium]